jgi:hypothetical protein
MKRDRDQGGKRETKGGEGRKKIAKIGGESRLERQTATMRAIEEGQRTREKERGI